MGALEADRDVANCLDIVRRLVSLFHCKLYFNKLKMILKANNKNGKPPAQGDCTCPDISTSWPG
jgi:hypothetical protein